MLKISNAIQEIIDSNQILSFWINEWLLNLSKTAEFILPIIEAKTKKKIKLSALIMNLSRFQKSKNKIKNIQKFKFNKIFINSDLVSFNFEIVWKIFQNVEKIYKKISEKWWFITVSKWTLEIAIITERKFLNEFEKIFWNSYKNFEENISSIWINFDEKYSETPWMISEILNSISMQWISIKEISSTFTEFIIYIDKKDLNLCFDILERKFF